MRSISRTLGPSLTRDIALVCLADGLVGVSYGAIGMSSGFEPWLLVATSLFVFAGAAQFMYIGLIAAGASPIAAAVAGLLINTRHLPFGLAVADVLGSGWRRAAGAHVMADETVAFALSQRDTERRRAAYWATGIGIFITWNLGTVLGVWAGKAIHDTDAFGLDAAFPAILLALVLPSLRDRLTLRAAVAGAAIALIATPFLPAGLPILAALLGLAFARKMWSPR